MKNQHRNKAKSNERDEDKKKYNKYSRMAAQCSPANDTQICDFLLHDLDRRRQVHSLRHGHRRSIVFKWSNANKQIKWNSKWKWLQTWFKMHVPAVIFLLFFYLFKKTKKKCKWKFARTENQKWIVVFVFDRQYYFIFF